MNTVRLIGETQKAYAHRLIDEAPADFVMKLAKETRRDIQNRKLWPMLADLQRQVPAMATYSADDIKLRFLNALGTEMRFLPTLEGEGMFPIGMRSSTLTVAQFAALIELILMFGAKHNVRWSDPKQEAA
jgi:hypothetical protein